MEACKHPEAHIRLISQGNPLRYRCKCTSCGKGPMKGSEEEWSSTGDEAWKAWDRFKKKEGTPETYG